MDDTVLKLLEELEQVVDEKPFFAFFKQGSGR